MGFTVPDLVFWVFTISDLVFWILSSGFYRSGFGVPAFRILLYFTSCPKWQKKFCLLHSLSQEAYIIWLWFLAIFHGISRVFFYIFKYWFSWLLGGGMGGQKGKKMAQNDKKFCPSHPVSQELYIKLSSNYRDLWCTFINWWYFQQFFFLFFKFWFIGVLVGKKGKKWPKTANISPLRSISQKL